MVVFNSDLYREGPLPRFRIADGLNFLPEPMFSGMTQKKNTRSGGGGGWRVSRSV